MFVQCCLTVNIIASFSIHRVYILIIIVSLPCSTRHEVKVTKNAHAETHVIDGRTGWTYCNRSCFNNITKRADKIPRVYRKSCVRMTGREFRETPEDSDVVATLKYKRLSWAGSVCKTRNRTVVKVTKWICLTAKNLRPKGRPRRSRSDGI